MADITDTNNTRGKLGNEWEMLEAADIDDCDREAIRSFVEHQLRRLTRQCREYYTAK